ncbi:MAG TPA: fimbria/pilus periplasmic chaperone [Nevskiaceae bacterium]|nr:fimbria/pilus periplasmic chaperone [Nevskiaceae bacterium]
MPPRLAGAAALLLAGLWAGSAAATVLQLVPIPVELAAGDSSAVLTIGNRGSEPVQLQIRSFVWTQEDGEDRLVPTRELVVSPPIAEIGPGQSLSARLVRTQPLPVRAEQSYRVWIDELPRAADEGGAQRALRMLMRYSVPVFVGTPRSAGPAPLEWRLQAGAASRLWAENRGGRRERVSALSLAPLAGPAAAQTVAEGLAGYVLAGQQRAWTLAAPVEAGSRYRLRFRTEAGEQEAELAAVPAP